MFPQQPTPNNAYRYYTNRPIRIVFVHHTAGKTLPNPGLGASWNHIIDRDPQSTIYAAVPESAAPHCVLKTDLWRPPSLLPCPDGAVSDANYCGLHVEIVYNPASPDSQTPNAGQAQSFKHLLEYYYAKYGPLPIAGHGEVQSDKWRSEPYPGLDARPFNFIVGPRNVYGHWLITAPPPTEPPIVDISDDDLKVYLEQLGTSVNMQTALIQRAALAYRRGENRGPAISGEYDYEGKVRQRFSAATAEYNPATGGVYWVELNLHPES